MLEGHSGLSNWRIIGSLCVYVSVILFIVGLFAMAYVPVSIGSFGFGTPPPFKSLGIMLVFDAMVLFAFGSIISQRYLEEETIEVNLN